MPMGVQVQQLIFNVFRPLKSALEHLPQDGICAYKGGTFVGMQMRTVSPTRSEAMIASNECFAAIVLYYFDMDGMCRETYKDGNITLLRYVSS